MKKPDRLYELDLLRFLAAGAVLFHHLAFKGQVREEYVYFEFHPLGDLSMYGYLGVDLFFLISGFVILMSAERATAGRFAASRALRLLPAYVVAVLLTWSVRMLWGGEALETDLRELGWNLTLVGGYFDEVLDFELMDGVYWSLFVELKFYLLVWLVLLLGVLRHVEGLLLAWLAITLASNVVELPWLADELLFPEWSPYFIAGALFYRLREHGPSALRIFMLAACYGSSIMDGWGRLEDAEPDFAARPDENTVWILVSVFYLAFILLAFDALRFLRLRLFVTLGALTYPLYLIHQNIGYILINRFLRDDNDHVVLALVTTGLLLLAWLIHRLAERPLQRSIRARLAPAATS